MSVKSYHVDTHGRPIEKPPTPALPPGVGQRIAAVVAGLGSYATTLLFLWAVGVPGWWGVVFAALVEFVLMMCKQVGGLPGGAAHVIDTFLNGGGLFPYVLRLDQTPTWRMLVTGLGLEGDVRSLPALILALAFGLVLSLAPLALWRGRQRTKREK